jgi:hypothetical protein
LTFFVADVQSCLVLLTDNLGVASPRLGAQKAKEHGT